MSRKHIDEVIGWYGMIALVVAYALLSLDFFMHTDPAYQFLNLTGALGIVYHSFRNKVYQQGILNIIWAAIAIFALAEIMFS